MDGESYLYYIGWSAATTALILLFMLLIPLSYSDCSLLWLWISSVFTGIRTPISHWIHSSHSTASDGTCIISLYALSLKIPDNIGGNSMEHLLNIKTTLGTCFKKLESVLVCKSLSSNRVDDLCIFWHVYFIRDENLFDIRYSMLIYLFEPILYVIKGCFVCNIIYE